MTNAITHFEIYGAEPEKLARFYRSAFGWRIEQMPGVDYWRVETSAPGAKGLHGGLMHRAIRALQAALRDFLAVRGHGDFAALSHPSAVVREIHHELCLPPGQSLIPIVMGLGEGLDIGMDVGSPVDFTYKLPFAFTGKIEKVTIELKAAAGQAKAAGAR